MPTNRKQIIQIVIIIICFGTAGFVLYNGLLKNSSQSALPLAGLTASNLGAQNSQDILPYGESLDFSQVILPRRFQYNVVEYPKLNPQTEVGAPESQLIIQPPPAQ